MTGDALPHTLGLDIGGTKTAVSRLTADGRVEEVARFPTTTREATLDRAFRELRSLSAGPGTVVGVSCGGPLDAKRGLILSPPNLEGWADVAICAAIADRFHCRCFLMNDANAGALAEWWYGGGVGCHHLVFLTSGTGMGAGFILNGRLYEGASGDAGEVGHLRLDAEGPVGFGKAGSFEGFCSGGGIARHARMRLAAPGAPARWTQAPESVTTQRLAEAADQGDEFALALMRESGARLGQALALLIDVLNPERIVIGGFFPPSRHLLEPEMRRVLQQEALPGALAACQIVPASLGATIGSHAAIACALYSVGLDPRRIGGGGRNS
ncbi:MAG TPA: ROK family protein [Opitutaceae bacterium]|nr:ROK family protein [Opitutaceae bacterium]